MAPSDHLTAKREQLRTWLVTFYTGDALTLSKEEHLILQEEVRRLEDSARGVGNLNWMSPAVRVVPPALDPFPKRVHAHPMLSLGNVYDMDELREWEVTLLRAIPTAKPTYLAEYKIDGVAISLIYEKGVLIAAVTRGSGSEGEEVTRNLKTVRGLPHRLPEPLDLEVRGEVYYTLKDFDQMNRQQERLGEDTKKNPRNAAAGTLRTLDTAEVGRRKLSIQVYAVAGTPPKDTDSGTLEWLEDLGFPVTKPLESFKDIDDLGAYYEKIRKKRSGLAYQIDGLVVKVDQFALREAAGSTSKSPRWAVALKFGAERVETLLEKVTWGVGRTGVLTPLAHLTPVELGGTTVAKATLHNFEQIERLKLRTGLQIYLEKGGDIIPKIVGLADGQVAKGEAIKRPTECPSCGTKPVRLEDEVDDYCVNPLCKEQQSRIIGHFVSRGAMDIESIGPALLKQLIDGGKVKTSADLYTLDADALAGLERMAEKSAANVIAALEASKTKPLDKFLFALGIRHVGVRTARVLARRFGSLEALVEADEETLADLNDMGAVTAKSIAAFFADPAQEQLLRDFAARGIRPQPLDLGAGGDGAAAPLAGKTVVITGTLALPRQQWKDRLERAGATVTGSVTGKTDYLLAGEKPGSKMKKAESNDVAVLAEADMENLLEGS